MTVITHAELYQLSPTDLSGLFGRISREVSDAKPGTQAWRDATVSLENIRREQARRRTIVRLRGPGL